MAGVQALKDISFNIISERETLKRALEQLDKVLVKILLVVDHDRFVAALTDGDVRRAILANASLETPVSMIANYHPIYIEYDDENAAQKIMAERMINALPVLNSEKKIIKIYVNTVNEMDVVTDKLRIPVVIMAGGL